MTPIQTGRDLRIDFLRGICLLVIYTRHVHPNVLRECTLSEIGFSDAAEAFIFLSGLVSGRAYAKALQQGFFFCQMKALRRCGEIYLAHLFTLFLNVALIPPLFGVFDARAAQFFQDPAWGLHHAFLLSFFPYVFTILALYILLLIPLPGMLWLSNWFGRWGMVLVSFKVYLAVQAFPEALDLPDPWSCQYYNPLAWQFLFFVGVALGSGQGPATRWFPKRSIVICVSVVGLVLAFFVKISSAGQNALSILSVSIDIPLTGKRNLEPLRLIHFALLSCLCWTVFPLSGRLYRCCIGEAVIRCGQNSLAVFCFGVLVTNLANGSLVTLGASVWWQLAVNLAGWSLLLLFASLLHVVSQMFSSCVRKSAELSAKPIAEDAALAVSENVQGEPVAEEESRPVIISGCSLDYQSERLFGR
jgi:hypothetical protein